MAESGSAMATHPSARRVTIAGSIGTIVEYYDFAVYGLLAATMAQLFFPDESTTVALIATFALFAISFLVRPIGGIIFGHIGDRHGRRRALSATITLMCVSTALIGVLPTHATIGIAAPVLLLLLRILQGLAAGGELGGAATYIAESSPDSRRGLLCSFTQSASVAGTLVATIVILVVTFFVSIEPESWGWRIPFLLSLPLGAVGLIIRFKLEDSPAFLAIAEKGETAKAPIVDLLRHEWRSVLRVVGITAPATAGFYIIFIYSVTYLQQQISLPAAISTSLASATLVLAVIAIPVFGHIADRVGRRKVLGTASLALILFSYPAFLLLNQGVVWIAFCALIFLGLCQAAIMGPLLATCAEQFYARARYTGFSLGFNVATSLFGGTAPLVATALIALTGDPRSPAFILIVLSIPTLATVVFALKESAGRPLPLKPLKHMEASEG